jgi:NAD(P)-dependent dehydrogenase (short-subunit alcohol dehydrogenase family)
MMRHSDSKVVLVTGAGQGMGLGMARKLAQTGCRVVINDYDDLRAKAAAELLVSEGLAAYGIACDVTSYDSVLKMKEEIISHFGVVDILINNVGIPHNGMQRKAFLEMPPTEWDRLLDINIKSALNCCSIFAGDMCDKGWGRIISIVSESWRSGSGAAAGVSLYAAGKGAVVGFSRQLSSELAGAGVTVNCISLGLMDNVPGAERAIRAIPMGRLGTANDAGHCAVFLASEDAGWITGQCIPVNGGVLVS